MRQLQLVSPSLSCSIFFSILLQGPVTYFSFHFSSVLPCDYPEKSAVQWFSFLLLLLTITRSGCPAEIKWSFYISKSQRIWCGTFSRMDSWLCIYYLFVWSNSNFLHNSQWITFSTQSCLVLYSFCVNLRHSIFIWLIVPSLSPHNLNRLFCCVFCTIALTLLVLMALLYAFIRRDSISLLRFIIIIIIPCEFFTPALADGLSQKSG